MKDKNWFFSILFLFVFNLIVFLTCIFNQILAGILGFFIIICCCMYVINYKAKIFRMAPTTQKERKSYLNFKVEEINLCDCLENVFVVGGNVSIMLMLPLSQIIL